MHKKYQLEDCFITFAEKYPIIEKRNSQININWKTHMNFVLIENLLDEDVRYEELIKKLYEPYREFYFLARFFLALKESGKEAFTIYQEEVRQNGDGVWEILSHFKEIFQKEAASRYRSLTRGEW